METTPLQGGSLRIFISQPNSFKINVNVKNLIDKEIKNGFAKLATYQKLKENASQLKNDIIKLLSKLKKRRKENSCLQCSGKGKHFA